MIPHRFFLTGTDTDVGKTVTSAVLCRALSLSYWKPVQSGLDGPTDSQRIAELSGAEVFPEAYQFQRPASPHASAQDESRRVELSALSLPPAERLLVEGAGGWMVPFAASPDLWQADVAAHFGLPVVVVARSGLGTLNHTLMTLRSIRADGQSPVGLILVGDQHPENERDLVKWGEVPLWFRLPRVEGEVSRHMDDLVEIARKGLSRL